MNKTLLVLASTLLLAACDTKDDTGGDTSGTGTDGGTVTDGGTETLELSMTCAWDASGLQVDLVNGDGAGYNLGLAETNGASDAWTGEDCYLGYTLGSGDVLDYCHPIGATGVYLEHVATPDEVVEGSKTLHSAALENTYFLEEVATADCWTWGDDTSYYGALGCLDIGGGCGGE